MAVAALILLRADMYQDASNADLPAALNNLGAMSNNADNARPATKTNLGITRNVTDFGAKCDVEYIVGAYTIAAGSTTVTLNPGTGTASITGNTMDVTALSGTPPQIGSVITGTGIASGTKVTGHGTGSGGTGTYIVSPSQTVGLTAITVLAPFKDIGKPKLVTISGHAAGGNILRTTITPTSTTTATLGAPSVPGTLNMFTTGLLSKATGSGYAPGDTITLAGGTLSATGGTAAIGTVQKTYVRVATIAAGGTGGTNGTYEVYGTTGNGMRVVGNLTVAGGIATGFAITDGGHYTSNPTTPATASIATVAPGMTLPTGVTLNLTMDVDLIAPLTPGLYANGGIPAEFTQASTSGTGTGATFSPMPAYNGLSLVYGTDDSAAFNTAMNPHLWPEPQTGAAIEMPERPCGIASTVTRSGASTELHGTSKSPVGGMQSGIIPTGSTLQWLGPVGGTMWKDQPITGAQGAVWNKMLGVGFSCGIPNGIFPKWSTPVAAVGLDARAQEMPEYGWLSFDACTKYDMYTDGVTGANFQHAEIHDISFLNANFSDGIGLYYASGPSGNDSDYAIIRNLWGVYQSAPLLYLGVLDNLNVKNVHFFQRGTQKVYGVDIAGPVYGTGETDHANSGIFEALSTSSVIRGLESSATPSTNVLITGFDQANNAPVIAERPGHGNLTFMDYNGRMQFPPHNFYNHTGELALGRVSQFNDAPFYIWGANKQAVFQNSVANSYMQLSLIAHDYSSTFSAVGLQYAGSGVTGNAITGVPNANLGKLIFQNTAAGLITTNGAAPIVFATSSIERGRFNNAGFQMAPVTVATLFSCGPVTKHAMVPVSDQLSAPTYRGALTGGGTIAVLAYCNGTSWEAH